MPDQLMRPHETVLFHVDIDSPSTLLRFWGKQAPCDVDAFYRTAMNRSLELFERLGVPATYFCVGQELESSAGAREGVLEAFRRGHEIANHTHSHPYGFTDLQPEDMAREIDDCARAIESVTGCRPVGFRAPSYDINAQALDLLRRRNYTYDASAAWNSLMPLIKLYHALFSKQKTRREFGAGSIRIPREPYYPSAEDWRRPGNARGLVELPVARTGWLGLPFYNNFHLMAGPAYRTAAIWGGGGRQIVYLIHLIEFVGLEDGLPAELRVHPNTRTPASRKIAFLEETMKQLLKRYKAERTDRFVSEWDGASALRRGETS